MHKNAIWLSFLIIISAVAFWFVFKAGFLVFHYFQLNETVDVVIEKSEIQEKKRNDYSIIATFSYEYKGRNFLITEVVEKGFPNPWAAKSANDRFLKKEWKAWLDSRRPERAILKKKFPSKPVLSALVLLGISIYFFCLGFYIRLNFK